MRRLIVAVLGAMLLVLSPAIPSHASVLWICNVPNEGDVTFVTAGDRALHGITTANSHAGETFKKFGELCRVETGP
jgi:hypothetical protein